MLYIKTFLIGLAGAFVFQLLHLPVPWLLGSLTTVFIVQLFTSCSFKWSVRLRDIGLIVVGLSLGSFFTVDLVHDMLYYLPMMLVLNAILLVVSMMLAFFTAKWCGIDFQTALVSSIPGGFSQLVIFAEDKKMLNLPVITYFHVVRVLLVVTLVPLIFHQEAVELSITQASNLFFVGLLCIAGYAAMLFARFLRIPVPAFLGPLIFVVVLSFLPMQSVQMSPTFLHVAQIFIGCHIGLSLKKKDLALSKRILATGILSALVLIGFTFITTNMFLFYRTEASFQTAFLSLAPGGLDQMSLIALGVGGDVAVVTLFQLFRILVIYLCVLPLLQKGIK